jgi:ribosomal protein S17E
MLTKEALGKYMLKYTLRSYAKITEKYDNMFQDLFSHFQNYCHQLADLKENEII